MDILFTTILSGSIFRVYGEHIRDGDFKPGFKAKLALKDLELMTEVSRSIVAPMPLAAVVRERLMAVVASGHGDLDWAALALLAMDEAGVGERAA